MYMSEVPERRHVFDGNACVVWRALSCDIVKADAGETDASVIGSIGVPLVRSFNFLKMNTVFRLKFLDERKAVRKRKCR